MSTVFFAFFTISLPRFGDASKADWLRLLCDLRLLDTIARDRLMELVDAAAVFAFPVAPAALSALLFSLPAETNLVDCLLGRSPLPFSSTAGSFDLFLAGFASVGGLSLWRATALLACLAGVAATLDLFFAGFKAEVGLRRGEEEGPLLLRCGRGE